MTAFDFVINKFKRSRCSKDELDWLTDIINNYLAKEAYPRWREDEPDPRERISELLRRYLDDSRSEDGVIERLDLEAALKKLPPQELEIQLLLHLMGLSVKQTAQALGLPHDVVDSVRTASHSRPERDPVLSDYNRGRPRR